ncbi:phosphoadenylyl-sulfate reductase [Luteococcus peritonei]|uniref:Adenosine 5'-phosphosulfate reductase n=1 Tax=Luteococcus peritonei TaxID=88874 RepID=A0ABW4RVI3_9ACTN
MSDAPVDGKPKDLTRQGDSLGAAAREGFVAPGLQLGAPVVPAAGSLRTGPRRSTEELRALVDANQQRLATSSAEELLGWAAEEFGEALAVACSMAADTILPALVSQTIPDVDVLFLETGFHFPETHQTRDALATSWPVNVVDVLPAITVEQQDEQYGPRLYERDPGACCGIRKVEPLARALSGYEAWVTGIRREDNALRANAQLLEWDATHELVKLNPIAAWSFEDVLDFATGHGVPTNPLLADGYPSIGCQPCTRRVAPGEDPRAGRWAGLAKTECGIHL